MTRKDYEIIAMCFRHQLTVYVEGSDGYVAVVSAIEAMSRALLAASKFTPNGNKSFKPEKFLAACGVK